MTKRSTFSQLAIALIAVCAIAAVTQAATITGPTQTDDTHIIQGLATKNFGAGTLMDVGFSDIRRTLIRFDVSSLSGQTVTSASLQLTAAQFASGAFTNNTINIYEITAANAGWVEGNGADAGTTVAGAATWNEKASGSTSWAGSAGLSTAGASVTTAGADYVSTPVGTITASSSDFSAGSHVYTVNFSNVAFLQDWIDTPSHNAGLLLQSSDLEANHGIVRFYQSDNTSVGASSLPILTVNTPEPATFGIVGTILSLGLLRRQRPLRASAAL